MEAKDLKQIKGLLDEGFEKQAVLINHAFQAHSDHLDTKLDNLKDELKTDIGRVEAKVDRALYTDLTHLEARVKRLERKTGLVGSEV